MYWKDFLDQLKDRTVKDLFWAVASPSPIDCNFDKKLFFPFHIQQQLVQEHLTYFRLLDENPDALHTFLKLHLNNKRLGYLFEAMLLFFFRTSPHINVLVANEQVFEGKQTIGEVDFIIEYDTTTYHIETSVKYYLNLKNKDDFKCWIGSSGNDDLNSKLEKVVKKQIPVAHHSKIKEKIPVPYTSYLWLKGKFFTQNEFPSWKNENASFGTFMTYSAFLEHFKASKKIQFYALERPAWMSDLCVPSEDLKCSWEELMDKIKSKLLLKKALHLGIVEAGNYQTLFLITDEVNALLIAASD
ncbi:MAG: DUF1853 family protein [Lishizhenia sp.]